MRVTTSKALLLVMAVLSAQAITSNVFANPLMFQIDDSANASGGRDTVSFTSDAPIELIVGHTNKVTGKVSLDDTMNLAKKPLDAVFNVDLTSIDTGIQLRNQHMRENFLHTDKYPQATFKLRSLSKAVTLKPGQKTKLDAAGDFTVNGVTVKKTIPVYVTWFKKCKATEEKKKGCDLLQISAEFPVAFKEHNIPRPEIVFQKLADTVIVKVGATGYSMAAPKAAAQSKPTEKKAGT